MGKRDMLNMSSIRARLGAALLVLMVLPACSPTVKVQPPSEPITINMNIKIEHEVLVRVDREIDDLLAENEGLFE